MATDICVDMSGTANTGLSGSPFCLAGPGRAGRPAQPFSRPDHIRSVVSLPQLNVIPGRTGYVYTKNLIHVVCVFVYLFMYFARARKGASTSRFKNHPLSDYRLVVFAVHSTSKARLSDHNYTCLWGIGTSPRRTPENLVLSL